MFKLSQINIYPVKSMRGTPVSHAQANLSGLAFDRIFMLSQPDGTFITARKIPALIGYIVTSISDVVTISSPDNETKTLLFHQFLSDACATQVWTNHFLSYIAHDEFND